MTNDEPFKDIDPRVLAAIAVHAITPEGGLRSADDAAATKRRAENELNEARRLVIEKLKRDFCLEQLYTRLSRQ